MMHIVKKPHWYMCLLLVMGMLILYRIILAYQNLIRNRIKQRSAAATIRQGKSNWIDVFAIRSKG